MEREISGSSRVEDGMTTVTHGSCPNSELPRFSKVTPANLQRRSHSLQSPVNGQTTSCRSTSFSPVLCHLCIAVSIASRLEGPLPALRQHIIRVLDLIPIAISISSTGTLHLYCRNGSKKDQGERDREAGTQSSSVRWTGL
jgi:hypothetical protein